MELKRNVKEFFRKIIDRFKGRNEKKTKCYWPEINRYCGCCELNTGIYIRSFVSVILSVIALYVNTSILVYLYEIEEIVRTVNLTNIDSYLAVDRDDPEGDHRTLMLIHQSLVVYYVTWISGKTIYIVTIIFTAFAIYKKSTWMLKLLLFISIPNWALDFITSLMGSIILRTDIKFILLISNLSEGYNILALNSEYKRLRGKPVLSADVIESQQTNTHICVAEPITQQPGYTQLHCRTCTCNENCNRNHEENGPAITPSMVTSNNENSNESNTNTSNTNVLNDALPEYTPNDTVRAAEVNTIDRLINEVRPVRPKTLEVEMKAKQDVTDTPIIYDQQQLNVGSSPVIEDRELLE